MRITLVGGTGNIGHGLALRLGRDTDHEIRIGSRESEKAIASATDYTETLSERGTSASISGFENGLAVAGADIVVLTVPPYHIEATIESIAGALDDETVLVSPAVGMQGDNDGLHYHPPSVGSVGQLVAETAPAEVPVVCAFTNLSAERLIDLDDDTEQDTLLVGDDRSAKNRVADLAAELRGIRPLDAGPLANAPEVESVTALLINAARYNVALEDTGLRLV